MMEISFPKINISYSCSDKALSFETEDFTSKYRQIIGYCVIMVHGILTITIISDSGSCVHTINHPEVLNKEISKLISILHKAANIDQTVLKVTYSKKGITKIMQSSDQFLYNGTDSAGYIMSAYYKGDYSIEKGDILYLKCSGHGHFILPGGVVSS